MNFTDGSGKALKKLGALLDRHESDRHGQDEDYFSDPNMCVIDLNTGETILIQPSGNEGGKTKGRGYRKCRSVEQRIPHRVPPSLQMAVVLDMLVPMLSNGNQVGPLAQAAYDRIATAMVDAQQSDDWLKQNGRHVKEVKQMLEQIQNMTWTTRKGDSLLNVDFNVVENAQLDLNAIKELEGLNGLQEG